MSRGLFITFEGGEGAGKTVQMERLSAHLKDKGFDVIQTAEPGGTPAADGLWDYFIAQKGQNWSPMTQLLFMFTLRTLHVENVITPALANGKIIVCARFTDSTRVYQGYVGGIPLDTIESIKRTAIGDVEPDVTFYLDIDPADGLKRSQIRNNGRDTFEEKDMSFHEKVRGNYLKLMKDHPGRCVVIDAARDIETIAMEISKAVDKKLAAINVR